MKAMATELSLSTGKPYPMRQILSVAELSSSAWYDKRPRKGSQRSKPGPRPYLSDDEVLSEIKAYLRSPDFNSEGYIKIHARLRRKGLRVGKNRVYKLMQEANLLNETIRKTGSGRIHDGSIITERPNTLWATDGNLHIRKAKSGYELGTLSFAQKEKELVEKFLKLMDCDATIRYRERRVFESTTAGELYYFSIGNNDIANDLNRLGVTQNKSLDMQFPEIPEDFIRHFVRGFFDGDGSVYLEPKNSIRVKLLSGSRGFIAELNRCMVKNGFSDRYINGGFNHGLKCYQQTELFDTTLLCC